MGGAQKEIPIINIGKYAGTPIDQLPVSYCRWMLGQDFPKEWLKIAKAKVDASPLYNEPVLASRHAIDRFSIRFIRVWQDHFLKKDSEKLGIATFLVKQAGEAWEKGKDVSKNRHQDDGIIKEYEGIKYVFNQGETYPELKELITVM